MREVAAAAHKYGLKFGIYLSPWDSHDPSYKDSQAYDRYYLSLLNELVTGYGELVEFWLDGDGSEGHVYDFDRYVDSLRVYQPNTLIFADAALLKYGDIRWVGNEDGNASEENWNVLDLRGYLRYRPQRRILRSARSTGSGIPMTRPVEIGSRLAEHVPPYRGPWSAVDDRAGPRPAWASPRRRRPTTQGIRRRDKLDLCPRKKSRCSSQQRTNLSNSD